MEFAFVRNGREEADREKIRAFAEAYGLVPCGELTGANIGEAMAGNYAGERPEKAAGRPGRTGGMRPEKAAGRPGRGDTMIVADAAALDTYLDKVVAAVAANGMDGYSFTTDPLAADATARIVDRLAAAKADGQLLVFEGNPLSLAAADRAKMDYVVLDTEKFENVLDVRLHALHAVEYAGIEAELLLLTAEINAALFDEDRAEHAAVDEMSRRVVELGPYAGLAAYNIAEDCYHSEMNYQTIRQAIQTLNPSK